MQDPPSHPERNGLNIFCFVPNEATSRDLGKNGIILENSGVAEKKSLSQQKEFLPHSANTPRNLPPIFTSRKSCGGWEFVGRGNDIKWNFICHLEKVKMIIEDMGSDLGRGIGEVSVAKMAQQRHFCVIIPFWKSTFWREYSLPQRRTGTIPNGACWKKPPSANQTLTNTQQLYIEWWIVSNRELFNAVR